jgi:hypothetical protein
MGGANFAYLRQLLAGSRLYAETKTLGSRVKFHREINDMMRERLGVVPDRWIFNYGHAVLDVKGLRRADRFRFAMAVSAVSYYAALRWNGSISRSMFQMTARWIGGSARATLAEVIAR